MKRLVVTGVIAASSILALAQNGGHQGSHDVSNGTLNSPQRNHRKPEPAKLTPQQKFVIDTVRMAVALPQPDPQDRLRVLSSAADVISPFDRRMARGLWREGVRIESELIQIGQTPAVSLMSSGQTDCLSAESFVENVPESAVLQAEQSLIGAVTACPKETLDPVSRKLDAALEKNVVAPRALMAAMDAQGPSSQWSQSRFEKMFASLPDPGDYAREAGNFAAMYAQMAPQMNREIAQDAGLKLLVWLGKLPDTPLRGLAIRTTGEAMQQALGEEAYQRALSTDVVAQSTANHPGSEREIERPEEESVSVLRAMADEGTDQTDALRGLPPTKRAREAAAHGFAAGAAGDTQQAGKYFDMAFSAVDEAWEQRKPGKNVAAVVQEVGEAAAQVDSMNALLRAQKLRDRPAQAIAMLAVARVVASNGITP